MGHPRRSLPRRARDRRATAAVKEKTLNLVGGLEGIASRHPGKISNVRGVGLYQGFTLHAPLTRKSFVDAALDRHSLLLMGAGTDSIRLRPNLSVTHKDINDLLTLLEDLVSA